VFDGIWLEYQQSASISFEIKQLASSVLGHACYNVHDIQFYYTAFYRKNKSVPEYFIVSLCILIH